MENLNGVMEDMEDSGVMEDIGVMDGTAIRGHVIGHGVLAIGGGNWET
jgi:hypothetical protein